MMLLVLVRVSRLPRSRGGFQRQVVHGEIHVPFHLVHVGVVVGLLLVAAAPRVAARLDLALAGDIGARVAIDDHVRQVDADDVLGRELFLECLQREQAPLVDELADARDRVVLLDVERQHRVGHRAVRPPAR